MGQVIAKILSGSETSKKETKEQLAFLVKAVSAKLDKYESDLHEMFEEPETVEKKMVPGIRALRWEREYRVGEEGISEAVNDFFGEDTKSPSNPRAGFKVNTYSLMKPPFFELLKKLINIALSSILGNNQAGEIEEQKFFIYVEHNAVIRIDMKMWKYNFSSSDIIAEQQNVFGYILCTSVVDTSTLKIDELVYLLSEYRGDADVEAYMDKLIAIWTKMDNVQEMLISRSPLAISYRSANFQNAALNRHKAITPPASSSNHQVVPAPKPTQVVEHPAGEHN
ncbi:hypothetical protein PIIN_01204 [Serendipita indica DSM 11827]|uniref:Uncharacterized protein n=1 Tax=Serendipita indica (strain DSM 11827) TaxID=1109443 RepID=G4T7T5_SERID|nr:hypothetical protein PIIN_01204 [Serendipita indica DSM 11827]